MDVKINWFLLGLIIAVCITFVNVYLLYFVCIFCFGWESRHIRTNCDVCNR